MEIDVDRLVRLQVRILGEARELNEHQQEILRKDGIPECGCSTDEIEARNLLVAIVNGVAIENRPVERGLCSSSEIVPAAPGWYLIGLNPTQGARFIFKTPLIAWQTDSERGLIPMVPGRKLVGWWHVLTPSELVISNHRRHAVPLADWITEELDDFAYLVHLEQRFEEKNNAPRTDDASAQDFCY